MKKIAKSLVIASSVMATGAAFADVDFCPYAGVDYYQVWMKGNKGPDALRNVFPKASYPGASAYVGARFIECLGVELGADWSARRKRDSVFATQALNVKVKRTGGHLDLVGFMPVADCFELLGSLGLGVAKAKTTATLAGVGQSISSKTKGFLRLGIGASYMITDMIGLRAKLGFENTRRLTVTTAAGTLGSNGTFKPFANSTTLSLGAFIKF